MPEGERRLAAIMFTDMVGYTALGQRNESLSLALVEQQRKEIRPVLIKHGGREVKTIGDGFLVQFPNAIDAVRCAYDIQRAIRELNFSLDPDKRIHLRVGVHVGEVVEHQGDISGDAVNVASRIEPLAEDGGVCISSQVYDHVRNKLGLQLASIGTKSLKNVREPVEVFRIVMPWEGVTPESEGGYDSKRVAVLPFVSMSPDPNDEYFADGMTEELITSLSGVGELTVIARTSVMKYKNAKKSASEIARELSAGSLVEGSVRKAANRVRVTVQLIDSSREGHLWAQNYDRQLEDVFGIQSEIAERVSGELKVRLLEHEKKRIEKRPTSNTEAYTFYLKGRYYWNERGHEAVRKGIEYFERSVALDPEFALGYSGLAACHLVLGFNRQAEAVPSFQKAREYSMKALELDPGLAEAHTVLGATYRNIEYDSDRAVSEIRRAIEMNPNYATAHQWYAQLLWFQKMLPEAEVEIKKALDLDPLSLIINTNYGDLLYLEGRFDEAIIQLVKVVEMEPSFFPGHQALMQTYIQMKLYDKALGEAELVGDLTKDSVSLDLNKARLFAWMGRDRESMDLLEKLERQQSARRAPFDLGMVHLMLGNKDVGFAWLQKAYEEHDSGMHSIAVEYELEGVRDDPRYVELVKRIGLERSLG